MEPGSDEAVAGVKRALATVVGSGDLDEDIGDYIASMVAEEPSRDKDEMVEVVAPFFLSGGVCDDDDAAAAMVVTLMEQLAVEGVTAASSSGGDSGSSAAAPGGAGGGGGSSAGAGREDGAPKLLAGPMTLGGVGGASTAGGAGGDASGRDEMTDFMWGRDKNAYANANTTFEDAEELGNQKKNAKAAARRRAKEEKDELRAIAAAKAIAAGGSGGPSGDGDDGGPGVVTTGSAGRLRDIFANNFTIGYPGRILFEDADLKLVRGRRYGLIGRNGMGKTTLLRAIASHELDGIPTDMLIMHVEQEVKGGDLTALDVVLATDARRDGLMKEAAAIEGDDSADAAAATDAASTDKAPPAPAAVTPAEKAAADAKAEADTNRLREIYAELEEIDAHTAEARASAILTGLGFSPAMLHSKTSGLSGGWRMRVSLACALFMKPELLMLDEPTNHLDFPAVLWLSEYLNSWEKTIVVVSHDREFLNDVATDIIHVDNKKLAYYRGNYDEFETQRAERRRHALKAIESQEARRKHMQLFIDKFRFNAKRASLVQSRIKALNRMETLDEVIDDPSWAFTFPDPGPLARPVLAVSDVAFGYTSDRILFEGVEFGVDTESRIAILGPNGAGKSTLLNLLLGNLHPTSGHVTRNGRLRTAVFTQHHVAQLDLHRSAVEHMQHQFGPSAKQDAVRAHLGKFGIHGDLALQKMATLSGGQKSRVAFAQITWSKPHLVCLDEPTNHLDTDTIDALIVACGSFNGGIVVVSHDQFFVNGVADEIWYVEGGRVNRFSGTLADYKKSMLAASAAAER